LLEVVHELIERFEAHLKAGKFYSVLANMRGNSAEEVTRLVAEQCPKLLHEDAHQAVFNITKCLIWQWNVYLLHCHHC